MDVNVWSKTEGEEEGGRRVKLEHFHFLSHKGEGVICRKKKAISNY